MKIQSSDDELTNIDPLNSESMTTDTTESCHSRSQMDGRATSGVPAGNHMYMPPLTEKVWPVMYAAAGSVARKRTRPATSSG